ncbi:hypothetical protein HPG69_011713 [Diceros bicornis minor]|uniref:C-type lectin domain-containing protein n=1 Tax=Diceros bicornis minor TaxID=77932 RepID=A0A7J7EHJ2_DICBM|nr:hypothetical protein HPG69_011713 [Diceros bicornis minor]
MGGFGAPLRRNQFILLVLFLLQIQSLGLDIDSHPTAEVCATHTISPGPKASSHFPSILENQRPVTYFKISLDVRLYAAQQYGLEINEITEYSEGDFSKSLQHIKNFCHLKGTVCDCGRYRKVVGQLDISVARLKTSMKFVKNVIAGIRETEEKFYYIVQEEKNYRESLTHCRIRGGMLAMPKDEAANTLIADYVAKSGFFRVFIGVNDLEREGQYVFTDNTPLQNYSNWKEGEPSDPYGHEDCVEMLSSGRWNDTECHLTMYFVCEFVKKKK